MDQCPSQNQAIIVWCDGRGFKANLEELYCGFTTTSQIASAVIVNGFPFEGDLTNSSMNIDFSTFYLISVPGFLLGIMTGRFLAGTRWQSLKRTLGAVGKLLGGAGLFLLFALTLITLSIMTVYLLNLSPTARPRNYWITVFVGGWMLVNLFFEIRDLRRRRTIR